MSERRTSSTSVYLVCSRGVHVIKLIYASLLVDMLLFAADSNSPVTIVLITGDHDYMYAVSKLMHRNHKVVVIAPSVASTGLKSIASEFHDWEDEVVGPARAVHRICPSNTEACEVGDTCDTTSVGGPLSIANTSTLPFTPTLRGPPSTLSEDYVRLISSICRIMLDIYGASLFIRSLRIVPLIPT